MSTADLQCAVWGTLCSNEVWAPEPANDGGVQPCRNASILGTNYLDFPQSEAFSNLSFILIGTPASLVNRVEHAIQTHAGNATKTVGPATSHIVIWAPHPFLPSSGVGWGAAQSHPVVKAAYVERKARKARPSAQQSKLNTIHFVHPGFLIESMRQGAHVPEDKFDLEKVISPQVWNWFSD